jgi:hypothetical protein
VTRHGQASRSVKAKVGQKHARRSRPREPKSPVSGAFRVAGAGFEPATSRVMRRCLLRQLRSMARGYVALDHLRSAPVEPRSSAWSSMSSILSGAVCARCGGASARRKLVGCDARLEQQLDLASLLGLSRPFASLTNLGLSTPLHRVSFGPETTFECTSQHHPNTHAQTIHPAERVTASRRHPLGFRPTLSPGTRYLRDSSVRTTTAACTTRATCKR